MSTTPPHVESLERDLSKTVPHAGFGMGIERAVGWSCGLHHVRETIPFPRMLECLTP